MRLSPVSLAVTAAVVWGAAILTIGATSMMAPGYGTEVLSLVASIYPGYDNDGSLSDLLLGSTYGFFDGLAGGFVFALLYNTVVKLSRSSAAAVPSRTGEPSAPGSGSPARDPSSIE